ncbi:MAG: SUMF1/EgtB/PvdO family nonheme iron enzyme [Deltaproteobacteria bacterium]|nr:SUMF1/EgtB/PvdO family nonheme iron enzyme [Deltaproteobacteria bacterium]
MLWSDAARGLVVVALCVIAGCGRSPQQQTGPMQPGEDGSTAEQPDAASGSDGSGPGERDRSMALPDGLVASPMRTAGPITVDPETSKACPEGMVLVSGEYCPFVGHRCVDFIDEKADRCAKYVPPPLCEGKMERRRFCVDRYEYPNLAGVKPAVMMSWIEAFGACRAEGKRLCLSTEWTMACEGAERLPYPYGYTRDKKVCNIDRPRPAPEPDMDAFSIPRKTGREVARLDLRITSGALEGCVSPFGVQDMTGNVDEWVINEQHFDKVLKEGEKPPFVSGLKGGYWGPIRARCRPITPSHNEWFRFYQVGFRCCSDAQDAPDGVAERYLKKLGNYLRKTGAPSSPAP